ncbi:Basic-leucine zipper (bZIP) transcription factor family protein [Actinidia rufa]|uniref:Basic-leucine zipper (BZIP) transcription factor family protein n=1 Tax=Actinidia rufa TaxID=165716 RepID=A0A7J0ENH3_9ERIC|nr:Basic-leucine zipper (bZIP) transcription factor family protein [Actinidia rufa]
MGGEEESLKNYSTQGHNRPSLASSTPFPSPFSPFSLFPHPSPNQNLNQNPGPNPRTMEEVWNDVSLASLHDRPTRDDPTRNPTFRGLTFLDFLSRPAGHNQPPSAGYGSPASPPAVALSLNSGPDRFGPMASSDPIGTDMILQTPPVSNISSMNVSFEALASAASLPELGKKRFPESDGNPGNRRHKRMIKNRESAARSRARKQENLSPACAYTNELELEVAHLMEENARLRSQQQQLYLAAASQVPRKKTLHRTSTAPF